MTAPRLAAAAALLLVSACSATPAPTPTPTAQISYVPLEPSTPSPTAVRYGSTVGPNPSLELSCRDATDSERTLFRYVDNVPDALTVELDSPWRVIVYHVDAVGDGWRHVVTNGERYAEVPDGWGGGYAALDVQLADAPRALAIAKECADARG